VTATATPSGSSAYEEYVGEEMSLVEHLRELRSRLIKCALALVAGFAVGFAVRNPVLDVITQPYCDLPPALREASNVFDPDRCSLIFTDVLGAFFISLKAAAIVAVVLAAPVICYQVLRFVAPGLRPIEKRYSIPFVVASQVLFAGGAVFSYFLIPRALEFLLSFAGPNIVSLMDASRYLTFVLQTMIAFGLSFEFPLILMILSLMGAVTARGLRSARRYAIFGTFVAAAIMTPTQDPLTMAFMAGPLVLFYEASILFAWLVERQRRSEVTLTG
jgi:sec-independent protein translocase protein TatC